MRTAICLDSPLATFRKFAECLSPPLAFLTYSPLEIYDLPRIYPCSCLANILLVADQRTHSLDVEVDQILAVLLADPESGAAADRFNLFQRSLLPMTISDNRLPT